MWLSRETVEASELLAQEGAREEKKMILTNSEPKNKKLVSEMITDAEIRAFFLEYPTEVEYL